MALKPPGQNKPISDADREKLMQLGAPVDVKTTPARTTDFQRYARSYTLEELSNFVAGGRTYPVDLFDLPWDEALAPAMLDFVKSDTRARIVLLAACGKHDEARALYDQVEPAIMQTLTFGGAHAAMAVGDYAPPPNRLASRGRLNRLGSLVRFPAIARRLAGDVDRLLPRLPELFADPMPLTQNLYLQIWTPALEALRLFLADAPDDAWAVPFDAVVEVKAPKHLGFTFEDRREALRMMFTLALQRGRLVLAHRIAGKITGHADGFRVRVAVEYARRGDLAGAHAIVGKMQPVRFLFDDLAQALRPG